MEQYQEQCIRLAKISKSMRDKHKNELEDKKKDGLILMERPDFLWHELLKSYSTWGGRRRGLIENSNKPQKVTYEELKKLGNNEERTGKLGQIMKDAGIRWYNRKATLLAQCFEKIEALGGLDAASETVLSKEDAKGVLAFLDDFPGIGLKYARNIMMDCYHPLFRNCIAIDARIKSVSRKLGLEFEGYEEQEYFYKIAAEKAGIEGWELNRLIWEYTKDFLEGLNTLQE